MDKASCLSSHMVSGGGRKEEIDECDECDKGVYLVWLDGNGMREGGVWKDFFLPIPPSEMERKSCDREFIFNSILIYMAPPYTFSAILFFSFFFFIC